MALEEFNRLIGQRIKELLPVQTVWAVCKAVDWEKKVMVATGQLDDLDYEDVALGQGWEFKKPKVGTMCLLGIEENNIANAFLIDAQELDEYSTGFDTTKLTITPEGFKIEREGENLFDCVKDLIGEIKKIVVIYGNGPDVPALTTIETRINKVLI